MSILPYIPDYTPVLTDGHYVSRTFDEDVASRSNREMTSFAPVKPKSFDANDSLIDKAAVKQQLNSSFPTDESLYNQIEKEINKNNNNGENSTKDSTPEGAYENGENGISYIGE